MTRLCHKRTRQAIHHKKHLTDVKEIDAVKHRHITVPYKSATNPVVNGTVLSQNKPIRTAKMKTTMSDGGRSKKPASQGTVPNTTRLINIFQKLPPKTPAE